MSTIEEEATLSALEEFEALKLDGIAAVLRERVEHFTRPAPQTDVQLYAAAGTALMHETYDVRYVGGTALSQLDEVRF